MEDGVLNGHLVYFVAFYGHLVYIPSGYFSRFGMLYQEKSGSPAATDRGQRFDFANISAVLGSEPTIFWFSLIFLIADRP
jgi:hypothetical protein